MRIARATLTPHDLPLRAAWRSAAGDRAARHISLIRLETDDGLIGHGECAALPSHGTETAEAADAALQQQAPRLTGRRVDDLLADPQFAQLPPAARAALDGALLDLAAQAAGVPLARFLNPAAGRCAATNAMAGAAIDLAPAALASTIADGFRVIKLKLGLAEPAAELAALRQLAERLPAGTRLRLDANRAWDAGTAARMCAALATLPVESLEEPLATPTPEALRALQRTLPYALALDESWPQFGEDGLLAAPPVRRLVLKPAACGGLRAAWALARRARDAGLDCVVTTGVDSACATLAAAQLAAALDNGLAHGLATSTWLAADTGATPVIREGWLELPETPGVGFRPTVTR